MGHGLLFSLSGAQDGDVLRPQHAAKGEWRACVRDDPGAALQKSSGRNFEDTPQKGRWAGLGAGEQRRAQVHGLGVDAGRNGVGLRVWERQTAGCTGLSGRCSSSKASWADASSPNLVPYLHTASLLSKRGCTALDPVGLKWAWRETARVVSAHVAQRDARAAQRFDLVMALPPPLTLVWSSAFQVAEASNQGVTGRKPKGAKPIGMEPVLDVIARSAGSVSIQQHRVRRGDGWRIAWRKGTLQSVRGCSWGNGRRDHGWRNFSQGGVEAALSRTNLVCKQTVGKNSIRKLNEKTQRYNVL